MRNGAVIPAQLIVITTGWSIDEEEQELLASGSSPAASLGAVRVSYAPGTTT